MTSKSYDAIIVGGGHNGLVTASYLAKAGLKTLVLERRGFVGGACSTEELFSGFKFSSCSYVYVLLQDRITDELELRKQGFVLYPVDQVKFTPFPDRHSITIWRDVERTAKEIGRFSAEDTEAYPKFAEFWQKAAGIIHHFFLRQPPTPSELMSYARQTGQEDILQTMVTWSIRDLLDEYFTDEHVKSPLATYGQDLGDPYAVGSILSAAYLHCSSFTSARNWGIVRGGMGTITQAMSKAAMSYGARIIV